MNMPVCVCLYVKRLCVCVCMYDACVCVFVWRVRMYVCVYAYMYPFVCVRARVRARTRNVRAWARMRVVCMRHGHVTYLIVSLNRNKSPPPLGGAGGGGYTEPAGLVSTVVHNLHFISDSSSSSLVTWRIPGAIRYVMTHHLLFIRSLLTRAQINPLTL